MENKINLDPKDPIRIKTDSGNSEPKKEEKSVTDLKTLLGKPSLGEVKSPFSDSSQKNPAVSNKPLSSDSASKILPQEIKPGGGKTTAGIAIALTAVVSALVGGIIIYLWQSTQINSANQQIGSLESQISNLQNQIKALQQNLEEEKSANALAAQLTAEGKTRAAVNLPKCNIFNKEILLKTTTKYSMFGDDIFDTAVCGFLQPKKDIIFEREQNIAYLKVLDFADEKFKASVQQGVAEGNTVNQATSQDTFLNLGCLNDNKIVSEARGNDNPELYVDPLTEQALLASSEAQPVAIVLSFGLHEGSGCNCCNLAHKVRLLQ
jgi:hypothetical protein